MLTKIREALDGKKLYLTVIGYMLSSVFQASTTGTAFSLDTLDTVLQAGAVAAARSAVAKIR